jgi:hypothetical protein
MNMVWHQSPGKARCVCFIKDISESLDKLIAIAIIAENSALLDASKEYMVKSTGSIYTSFAGHAFFIALNKLRSSYLYIYERPYMLLPSTRRTY